MAVDNDLSDLAALAAKLKEKYRVEREKRLRPDGPGQYRDFSGVFADESADPYTPRIERPARDETVDVAIIGGGFGGMLAAARLRQAGVGDFRIIEKGGDFGGTWYWNRYPGARCDVESYIYLPLIEEMGYVPREKYATSSEIFAYCQQLGHRYRLYENALFHTEVEDTRWDEAAQRWRVTTERGDSIAARFLIIAGGVLHKPKLPGIPGIESFAGHSFHTSRWDYAYTGGGPDESMDGLADKRVGIIGTGATSVQAIPPLAASARELYVFQRTPSGVGVRGNGPTDTDWFSALEPGWQKDRLENFTLLTSGGYPDEILVNDGWTQVFINQIGAVRRDPERAVELRQLADYQAMERVRARIGDVVHDPEVAEALKPWYNQMCKRPCFHDEYLETFNRPNVTLVQTPGHGVDAITPAGAVVDGTEYPLDCLIYASGFESATSYSRRLGFDIHGRGGIALSDSWARDGASTLHGVQSRGYPNLFLFSTTQAGTSINFVHVLIEVSEHIAHVVSRAVKAGVVTIEPTKAAEEAWFEVILGHAMNAGDFQKDCTPGYFNNEGKLDGGLVRNASFMGNPLDYFDTLQRWRAAGDFAGLEVRLPAQPDGAPPLPASDVL